LEVKAKLGENIMPALIFDCDGVLADTEKDGHLLSFNKTFEHFNLPITWSLEDYAEKLKIGGGKERLKSLLTPDFIAKAKLPNSPELQTEEVAKWHKYKTNIYTDLVQRGVMPARPGVARIVKEAHAAGWTLAVASTSQEESVRAVLVHAVGKFLASHFTVFAGDIVSQKKPAPDIYLLAIDKLNLNPDDVIVIEDSNNGLQASLAAGLKTIVTVSSFTTKEDFSGASLVVSSLGDADGERTNIISNPLKFDIKDEVNLSHLSQILKLPTTV
jgi:HAD superfamily hydrolase (TIGR01509 family)